MRGIAAVGFCRDAKLLAAVGMDNNHTIFVWDWRRNNILAELKGHTDVPPKVYGVVAGAWSTCHSCIRCSSSAALDRGLHTAIWFFLLSDICGCEAA